MPFSRNFSFRPRGRHRRPPTVYHDRIMHDIIMHHHILTHFKFGFTPNDCDDLSGEGPAWATHISTCYILSTDARLLIDNNSAAADNEVNSPVVRGRRFGRAVGVRGRTYRRRRRCQVVERPRDRPEMEWIL